MLGSILGVYPNMPAQNLSTPADPAAIDRAANVLRTLLAASPSRAQRIRALVILGDLLSAHDPAASRDAFAEALAHAVHLDDADELLGAELHRAREVLKQVG